MLMVGDNKYKTQRHDRFGASRKASAGAIIAHLNYMEATQRVDAICRDVRLSYTGGQ